MISISTPNKELLRELNDDYNRLGYWLKKKVGGEKKLAELQGELVRKYYLTGKVQTSDPIEYISRNGNKWYGYYKTVRMGGLVCPNSIGFCYYETYGSIGAFVPASKTSIGNVDGVVIFPSHFFLRLSQRLGVGVRSREVVKLFLDMLNSMVIQYKGDSDKRKDEVEVSFSGSVWRGRWKDGDSNIIELSTFLKHSELSEKQKRKAKALQAIQDAHIPRCKESDLERLEHGDAELWVNELLSNVNAKDRVQDVVSGAYFNYYNTTYLTAEEVGMKISPKDFDGLLKAESKGECRLGMLKFIYQHAYNEIPEDRFFNRVLASVFVVLRKLGYNGSIDDLHPYFENAVKKFSEWKEGKREEFNKQFKNSHNGRIDIE